MSKQLALIAILAVIACSGGTVPGRPSLAGTAGIHKIRHVVVIMQENRSFDSYFGTFPGVDGIPAGVCVSDPHTGQCAKPYHDPADRNAGGPHGQANATADVNGRKMDGFIAQAEQGHAAACTGPFDPNCGGGQGQTDVMGYHDAREIPNYWTYARDFVLQDRMFEPNASWSLPEHLFMVSEWSARCSTPGDPMSCQNALQSPAQTAKNGAGNAPDYAWTDLTYLLHKSSVSWKYYVAEGTPARLRRRPGHLPRRAPEDWNARDLESAPLLRHGEAGWPAGQHPDPRALPRGRKSRPPTGRFLGGPQRYGQRAPASPALRRPGLHDAADQRDHAGP